MRSSACVSEGSLAELVWDDCLACSEFEGCYKLGLAKVTLEAAIAK